MDRQKLACVITAHARLHITLLAMHSMGYRANGGIGFAVSEPAGNVASVSSQEFSIVDTRSRPLSDHELDRLLAILESEKRSQHFSSAVDISISGPMPTHSGFGSSTAITLACVEALHTVNNSNSTASAIVFASGRGGTSGIGINTYFSGGCILDLGRPSDVHALEPSHKASPSALPLLAARLEMPDWDIGICLPRTIECKSPAEEEAFFARTCPIPSAAVYETLYHVIFGLYAGIREQDWDTVCKALNALQECYWKKAERDQYGQSLTEIETLLRSFGASAVAMSSLGPSLFFLARDVSTVAHRMQSDNPDCDFILTRPHNRGRTIQK